jgi:hypothetical protein
MKLGPFMSRSLAMAGVLCLMVMCLAGFCAPARNASADAYSNVSVQIDHPSFAGTSSVVQITITAYGGPAADVGGDYTVSDIEASGTNTTGFDWEPKSPTNEEGIFTINLTMPAEGIQTVKFTVNVTSRSSDYEAQRFGSADFQIRVVEPIVISAVVYNTGAVEADNVTANFYADGTLIHTVEFAVTAGNSTRLTYNWTFSSIRNGRHEITVTVDDPDKVVEFSNGNNALTLTIYVGEKGNPAGAVLTVVVIILAILFVLTYLQKPVKRTKKF